MFTARYGLIPYIKQIAFRLLKVKTLRLTVLPHPPYGAHLSSSDSHPFGALKGAIRGKSFASFDRLIEEVKTWLRLQISSRYKKRFRRSCSFLA